MQHVTAAELRPAELDSGISEPEGLLMHAGTFPAAHSS